MQQSQKHFSCKCSSDSVSENEMSPLKLNLLSCQKTASGHLTGQRLKTANYVFPAYQMSLPSECQCYGTPQQNTTTEAMRNVSKKQDMHSVITEPNKMCTLMFCFTEHLYSLLKFMISSPVNFCSLDSLQKPQLLDYQKGILVMEVSFSKWIIPQVEQRRQMEFHVSHHQMLVEI